jgi:hypothetical protein
VLISHGSNSRHAKADTRIQTAAAGRAKQQKAHAANAYKQRSQNARDSPKKLATASWIE